MNNIQTSTLGYTSEQETVEKKSFKYISLFAGIGGFDFGLNAVGGVCVFASEIDKFAKQAYTTLHGLEPHGDITKIDAKDIPDHDVIAAGFPCQSFSVSGKRGGFEDARGTLFFEVARIASEKQPKILLLENVKGLIGNDKGKTLDTIVKTLNDIGYRVDFEVLNSKFFGVPQNRERIFIVAIREDLVDNEPWNIVGNTIVPKGKRRISGYEDVKTFNFDWPTNDTVQLRLKDVLESEVDERFYINENKTKQLIKQIEVDKAVKVDGVNKVASMYGKSQAGSVYDPQGISATLDTAGGGYREPIVTVAMNRNKISREVEVSYCLAARDYKGFSNQDMTGVIEGAAYRSRKGTPVVELNEEEYANALTSVHHDSLAVEKPNIRIRKSTPLECWRLQGFTDEQHNAVEDVGISNSQRYKQAGNAVTVNVIKVLGEKMLPLL